MNYRISVAGFEGRDIQVKSAGFFSDYKLFVDGQQAPKGPKRDQMVIRRNDGVETIATWKRAVLGLDVPQLVIENQVISVVKPLQWYEWLWSGLPIILVFTGGALGGAIGALAFALNAKIFRAEANGFLKYFFTAVVSILSVLLLLLIVFLLFGAPEQKHDVDSEIGTYADTA